MRTTSYAARGRPLAALLFLVVMLLTSWTALADAAVEVRQQLDPEEIFVAGSGGEPSLAKLTLQIQGLGPTDGYPIDCVLLVDTSATADLATAKAFVFDLIDQFSVEDRIGLVSYATTARLDVPLTYDRTALKTAIGDLAVGGKSALGLAMQMGRRELLQAGREDAILVEILLSDGQSNAGIEPGVEGEIASESGITVVSVGIGSLINRNLMETFARETNGLFFPRPSESALTDILEHLFVDIAASDILVEKRFSEGLRYVSARPSPSDVETMSDGTTSVTWRIVELQVGQAITIDVEIEADQKGEWSTDIDSLVTYTDFRGLEGSVHVPSQVLSAIEPNRVPVAMFVYEPETATTADTVRFTDLSFDPDEEGRIVSWQWDFGDGSMGSEQNPEHRYAESGEYTVRLTAVDDSGGVSTDAVVHISIADPPPPVAVFDYKPASPSTTDIVSFIDQAFHPVEGVDIVSWEWDFGDGSKSEEQNPEHRYAESGEYTVRLRVIDGWGRASMIAEATIDVASAAPIGGFVVRDPLTLVEIARPRVGEKVLLDASTSYDPDGLVERYEWDFDGDGTIDEESRSSDVVHTFATVGEIVVALTVVDNEGVRAEVEKALEVIQTVVAQRTIETGLPDDWTVPSGVAHVTLSLRSNTTVNGMSVTETIPVGWTFTPIESDGATMRENGQTIEWLFLEKFVPSGVNSSREIRYTLTAPDTVSETLQATISGKIGSSSPRIAQAIAGEDRVTATSVLPVPVVISRWDVTAETLDPYLGETIAFDQIQYAMSLWLSGEPVLMTGDMTITLATMQDLIAYWLTGSSVHDPLP